MVLNKKVSGRASSIPAGLAVSGVASMVTTLMVTAIGASLIARETLPQEQFGFCAIAALLLGSIFGAVTAVKRIKHRKMLVGVLSGVVYYIMLLGMTVLFFGGRFSGLGVTLLVVLCGSLIGALLSSKEPGKGRIKNRRKIHC